MADPLAQYRRPGSTATEIAAPDTPQPTGGKEAYAAFSTKDRVKAIDIFCKDGSGHSPTYNYLLYVNWDRKRYTQLALVFSFLMVKVTGRNLHDVVQALRLRKCEYLCEFDPTLHQEPASEVPYIASIEVVKSAAAKAFMEGFPGQPAL
jgi:hypothetical protein